MHYQKGEKVEVLINGKWIPAFVTSACQYNKKFSYSVELISVEEENMRKYDDSGYVRVGSVQR
jgi:hypothetical protein